MYINKKYRITVPVMLVVMATVLGSLCIDQSSGEKTASANQTNISSQGGILRYADASIPTDTLDPTIKWTGWSMREAGIYETLFSYDENMDLQPELAEKYEQISDTEWKIHIREGVKFHDGTPLDADAVIYSLNRVLDSNNSRKGEYDFIEYITKDSENVVTIKTKYPYAPTIASLTDPVTSIVSPSAKDLSTNPVGTGPFKFKSFSRDVSLVVERNEDYWNGIPRLHGAIIYYVPDEMSRIFKLENNEVDIASDIPQSEVERLSNNIDFTVYDKETLRTYFLYINTKKAPFDDVKVRQALNCALDRQQIVDSALEGVGGTPAKSIFPSVMEWSINDKIDALSRDEQKAKKLLTEAGFSDVDADGWLEYNGEPFELNIKTYTTRPQLKPAAEVIESQFESIGLKTSVNILQSGAIETDMDNGNYDLSLYAWGVAPTGDPDYILSKHFESTGSEAQRTGYSNPQVDEWIEAGRQTMDPAQRKEYYDSVQMQVMEDCPELFVFYQNSIVGANAKVGGFKQFPNEVSFLTKDIYLEE
jgi:peptide/nickel transport system substrate-binding protein